MNTVITSNSMHVLMFSIACLALTETISEQVAVI